jgi:hypothetical protein
MGTAETHEIVIMSLSIAELMPEIAALSHSDKFRLVQLVLAQLAQETGVEIVEEPHHNRPAARKRSRRGSLKHYAKPELIPQEQDAWQAVASEKHEHR